jgi:hypothetical protein
MIFGTHILPTTVHRVSVVPIFFVLIRVEEESKSCQKK